MIRNIYERIKDPYEDVHSLAVYVQYVMQTLSPVI